jgi:hypothetical protein
MPLISLTSCLGKLYREYTFIFTLSTQIMYSDSLMLRHFATKLVRTSSNAFMYLSTATSLYGSGTILHNSSPSQEKRLGDY